MIAEVVSVVLHKYAEPPPAVRVATVPVEAGISAQALADRIDQFLASRGYTPPPIGRTVASPPDGDAVGRGVPTSPVGPEIARPASEPEVPAAFVCEEDVRLALRAGKKLMIGDKTIVTPAARDLGDANKVFVQAGWPR